MIKMLQCCDSELLFGIYVHSTHCVPPIYVGQHLFFCALINENVVSALKDFPLPQITSEHSAVTVLYRCSSTITYQSQLFKIILANFLT